MKSLQIWVFIRIISAKSTPAWQTPHPLIWSKRDKKKKKTGGGLAPGWCGISLPLTWATQHEELAELEVTCIELCFNLHLPHASPGCLHRSLHCFAHYVTIAKKNKKCYPAVSICICSRSCTHTHRHTHHTCRSHNTPRCISQKLSSATHTHTNSIVSSPFQNSEHIRAHCYGCLFPSANAGRFRGAEWHPNVG